MGELKVLLLIISAILAAGCSKVGNIQNETTNNTELDSLREVYGQNKQLPEGFEMQALHALSHYPELEDVRINFIVRRALIPLASRPYIFSLLRDRQKRRYKVVISERSLKPMEPVLLKNLPYNAQVAIIGHELAHTSHYQEMKSCRVVMIGLSYFSSSFRAELEKGTDRSTIDHGLGEELLEYAEHARRVIGQDERQREFMDKYYLNPMEIRAYMQENQNTRSK